MFFNSTYWCHLYQMCQIFMHCSACHCHTFCSDWDHIFCKRFQICKFISRVIFFILWWYLNVALKKLQSAADCMLNLTNHHLSRYGRYPNEMWQMQIWHQMMQIALYSNGLSSKLLRGCVKRSGADTKACRHWNAHYVTAEVSRSAAS